MAAILNWLHFLDRIGIGSWYHLGTLLGRPWEEDFTKVIWTICSSMQSTAAFKVTL